MLAMRSSAMTLVGGAPERRPGLFEIRLRTIQPTKGRITEYKPGFGPVYFS
jgi:hypothetical protein